MTIRQLINSDLIFGGSVRISDYETLEQLTDDISLNEVLFFHSDLLDREIKVIHSSPNERIPQNPEVYYCYHNSYINILVA